MEVDIGEQLLRYRKQKEKEERYRYYKEKLMSLIKPFQAVVLVEEEVNEEQKQQQRQNQPLVHKKPPPSQINVRVPLSEPEEYEEAEEEEEEEVETKPDKLNYLLYAIYFLLWATLYAIAIELQFGIVFLIISALAGIYLNTSTRRRKRHEMSAYSVFNKNCESIDGTLKAEQFEREIGVRL